jgi:uncharacterized protein
MPTHRIIFTADLHGNEQQYQQLVDYAITLKAKSVIIGGDICPKVFPFLQRDFYIQLQGKFLEERLPFLLSPLKSAGIGAYLIMGNDDAKANLPILEKYDDELYHIIHSRRLNLTEDFDIVGYPYVSITPFGIKDWEKYEFSSTPESYRQEYTKRKLANYRLDGIKSTQNGWENFRFDDTMAMGDSIQNDLLGPEFREHPKKTIYVIHAPPSDTKLDMVPRGSAGSFAVREFIENAQPYLTLHGHIHETVELSGSFRDRVRNTLCMAAGNLEGEGLALIVFDLYHPENAERIVIPAPETTEQSKDDTDDF